MSNNLWSRFSGVLIILAGSLTLTSCASVQNVTSSPTNEAVVVDGMRNDWMGRLTQIEDDNIAFGFKNDDKSLYILVVTANRQNIMKILNTGLTLWINSEGGEELGFRYPLKPLPEDLREIRGFGDGKKDQQQDPMDFISALKRINNQIQVITKDEYPIYTADAAIGKYIKGNFNMSEGQFVIELQIPLKGDDVSDRLFQSPSKTISLNFETGKFDTDGKRPGGGMDRDEDDGGGMPGSGGGHGGGMGKGKGGNRPGGGERPNMKQLKYGFKVELVR
ncbi:MAG: hypothetical protein IPG53_09365 [Ignavibacteriales bacterium]|nr:hypothetical protein [Ignavibacteriales bacterium]